MKDSTLRVLITAKALLELAERQCSSGDKYLATAGIIILQDAVELAFLAVLLERGVDEYKSLESLSFDQMIGEIRTLNISLPKSGTLKAMNKLRVTAKHYGQLMEPITVQGHVNTAKFALDAMLTQVVGKPMRDIYMLELIPKINAKAFLEKATEELDQGNFMEALINTRKAFYIEFESDYCIYGYKDKKKGDEVGVLLGFLSGGRKALYWTKNQEWISENVKTPFDYIQIDYERLRIDALEKGINTQALNNIRRLTPEALRLVHDGKWHTKYDAGYPANSATKDNASYCLDLVIDVIRRKREHLGESRTPPYGKIYDYPPAYIGQSLFKIPDLNSEVIKILEKDDQYTVKSVLNGFDPDVIFYRIECTDIKDISYKGYVQKLESSLETEMPQQNATES